MQEKRKDEQIFSEDKPDNCTFCYFWSSRRKTCTQDRCYYLLSVRGQSKEKIQSQDDDCAVCPYGKHSPCIGYCIKKIIREMNIQI